ncbi:hypothetical protein K1719_001662 [Acacia pycnantha]|nr:hypothetical protein K1719_001662 [Acacia pycnantha]
MHLLRLLLAFFIEKRSKVALVAKPWPSCKAGRRFERLSCHQLHHKTTSHLHSLPSTSSPSTATMERTILGDVLLPMVEPRLGFSKIWVCKGEEAEGNRAMEKNQHNGEIRVERRKEREMLGLFQILNPSSSSALPDPGGVQSHTNQALPDPQSSLAFPDPGGIQSHTNRRSNKALGAKMVATAVASYALAKAN